MTPFFLHRIARRLDTHRGRHHLDALDGLRGLAMLLVFMCHFQVVVLARLGDHFQRQPFYLLAEFGASGVDLFFLLSGYLVYGSFLHTHTRALPFLLHRLRRIYPAFLAAFAAYAALAFIARAGHHYQPIGPMDGIRYFAANLLLLPGVFDLPNVLYPAWSLSFEALFYLSLPLLVPALRLRQLESTQRLELWIGLLCSAFLFALLHPSAVSARHFQQAVLPPLLFFPAGMAIAEADPLRSAPGQIRNARRWTLVTTAVCSLLVYGAAAWPMRHAPAHNSAGYTLLQTLLLLTLYAALLGLALGGAHPLAALLRSRFLRWTGNISYSLYLVHGLALDAVASFLFRTPSLARHPLPAAIALLVASVGLTTLLTAILFSLVERPCSLPPRRTSLLRPT